MDLRVSGKDLITNHIVMMFFNHDAIFGKEFMPKKIYINGHIMINGIKMSKSKGNFITLEQAIQKYGSIITRFITATAGDDTNDGNLMKMKIDSSILALYAEINNWSHIKFNNMRTGEYNFYDHLHLFYLKIHN